MFFGEHCINAASSRVCSCKISSRGTDVGSSLIKLADSEAFAIARVWAAMSSMKLHKAMVDIESDYITHKARSFTGTTQRTL